MAEIDQVPPTTLGAALDALEADHELLTVGDVSTPGLIETWMDIERIQEIAPVQLRPHPPRARALIGASTSVVEPPPLVEPASSVVPVETVPPVPVLGAGGSVVTSRDAHRRALGSTR